MADANDVVRAAFDSDVQTVLTDAGITWPLKPTRNDYASASGPTSFVTIEFQGGNEEQLSAGDRGNNLWREEGTVWVRLFAPLNAGSSPIEGYASSIRRAYRDRTITRTDGREITTRSGPPDSYEDGVRWVHSIMIGYRTQNRG